MFKRLWQQLAIATNWPILVAVAVLSLLGLVSIWTYRPPDGLKQLIYLCAAVVCLALFQWVNYQRIGRFAWGFYILSLLLVVYTVLGAALEKRNMPLPGVHAIKGACNWINFGPISLQPAELVKVAFVLVLARYLRFRSNYRTLSGLLPPFVLALVPLALILKQPDLGTALVFIPTLFVMLFGAGAKLTHLLAIMGLGMIVAPILWLAGPAPEGPGLPLFRYLPVMVKPYQRDRVYAMFSKDPAVLQNTGFQQEHSMIALGSGGPSGKGLGNIPVGQGVPEAHNDMVFALIGEQFGFFGSAVVIGAYVVLFAAGIEIAAATREPFGRLLALGIVAVLAGQTFMNLMVTVRLMPVTGVTLPFVSYGGSSLLASFMAAGLLLNIGQNRPLVVAGESFEY